MTDQRSIEQRCDRRIAYSRKANGGKCGKPGTFRVWYTDGPVIFVCGIHAKKFRQRPGFMVVPA